MSCAIGENYTITLSDDGVAHAFGKNDVGQLGSENDVVLEVPTPIPNLPPSKYLVAISLHFVLIMKGSYGHLGIM